MSTGYPFVFSTIMFIVVGQFLIKFGTNSFTQELEKGEGLLSIVITMFTSPFILGGFFFAGLAAIFWVITLTKMSLSAAYPFMAIPIVVVLVLSPIIFGETVLTQQWIGGLLVCFGLYLSAV